MSSVLPTAVPAGWQRLRFDRVVRRSKEAGRPELDPLSVYLEDGVVPRSSREDNHNRLGADMSNYLVVNPGDIVFNKLRTWQGGLGVSRHLGVVSPAYFVCRPIDSVDSRYYHYLLRSNVYLAELTRLSKFMPPSQFDIAWDELRTLPILVPPLPEQQAIADYLDAESARIDALITKKRRMIEALDERKTAIMLAAVSGAFGPGPFCDSDLEWLQHRPARWDEVLLRLVAATGSGHTPSRERADWWENPTIPWITTGEVRQVRDDRQEVIRETREKISELGLANSSATVHPAATVVLCRTASAGYSGIMGTDMATSQDFATWTCGPLLRPRFLLLCLRAMRPDLLGRLATGSTHKTIYMPDIHALRIPLPPVAEQDAAIESAGRALEANFGAMAVIEKQIDLLAERRQALITAAVTGELEIPGAAA